MKPIKLKYTVTSVQEKIEEDYVEEGKVILKSFSIGLTENRKSAKKKDARLSHPRHFGDEDINFTTTIKEKAHLFRLGEECTIVLIPKDNSNF